MKDEARVNIEIEYIFGNTCTDMYMCRYLQGYLRKNTYQVTVHAFQTLFEKAIDNGFRNSTAMEQTRFLRSKY